MTSKILVVDDDNEIRELVSMLLEKEGFAVECMPDAVQAVEAIKSGKKYSLIVMDIGLPGIDGFEAVKRIRVFTDCPVLYLTAKSAEEDMIRAFDAGGDDFISKPFSSIQLVLSVKALLRRYKEEETAEETIKIDAAKKRVFKNGEPVKLTEKEFEVLYFLYSNRGVPFDMNEIYENVWKEACNSASANKVMVHILNLRKKLEDNFKAPKLILTEWGKGYLYVEKS